MIEPIVCVPTKNEAERLPYLMQALHRQTWLNAYKKPLRTVIVLNNCNDKSYPVATRVAQGLPSSALRVVEVQFPTAQAHVGSARRLAMDTGLALAPKNSALLSTDADAIPRERLEFRHSFLSGAAGGTAGRQAAIGGFSTFSPRQHTGLSTLPSARSFCERRSDEWAQSQLPPALDDRAESSVQSFH